LADPLLEAKLSRPPTRSDWVERVRLLKVLDHAVERPIVLVAAPAGFGKTTLVTQWLASNRGPPVAAWISLDAQDNDPVSLWTDIALALEQAGCRLRDDVTTFVAAHGGEVIAAVLPHLLQAMADMENDLIILLDDFHLLQDPACHNHIELLVQHLPPRAHLMIITRADPGLRLGRLRATGRLAEIRAADLAFTAEETSALLAVEGVRISTGSVQDLVQRTEGWAAGLYLASLSMAGRSDPDEFAREVSNGNRFIGDYLTEEVLAKHSPEVREFIKTMSIVDRFSAPLCDFMTGATGSAALLHELERSNLFLVPLDEQRTWFRFHHLFASVARSELELDSPDRVPGLHAKAARWFRDNGHTDEAVMHSLASGSTSDAALLVQANWLKYVEVGRGGKVRDWLRSLGTSSIATDPAARVTAAWMAALSGDRAALEAHLTALEELKDEGPLPDGTRSVESAMSMIQGIFGYGGPIEMMTGAQRAVELETDDRSPYYSIAHLSRGHAAYVAGDLELATRLLAKASHNEAAPAVIRVMALATRSLTEGERLNQDLSRELAESAMAVVDADGLRGFPQASLAFTALAQAQATANEHPKAVATIEQGLLLRRRTPELGPWATVHHLLVASRLALDAGEHEMAQHLVEEVSARMDAYRDGMESMRERLRVLQDRLPSPVRAVPVREVLTDRELDILKLLQSSLSLTEIAGELYISRNTVKTHAKAVYRKLGASSRTEAVKIARARLLA
jgi:LuxR family maltose regulon positive regulatory protein